MHARTQAPLSPAHVLPTAFFLILAAFCILCAAWKRKGNQEGSCGKVTSALCLIGKTQNPSSPPWGPVDGHHCAENTQEGDALPAQVVELTVNHSLHIHRVGSATREQAELGQEP